MKYSDKITVTRELLSEKGITKDMIVKDLINRMIHNISLEELKKLFNIVEKDPHSDYWEHRIAHKLHKGEEFSDEEQEVFNLKGRGLIQYEAKIKI